MAAIEAVLLNTELANWYFIDETSPAVDPEFEPAPVALIGSLIVPGTTTYYFGGPIVSENERDQVVKFYFNEGISAEVLRLMTAEDALARVPVEVLRQRKPKDVPLPPTSDFFDNRSKRRFKGTVTPAPLPLRVFDQSRVPNVP